MRILEILQTKDEQANKNLGDPASFLHVFDPEKEAAKVADIMATGTSPEQFEATIDAAQASSDPPANADEDADWLLKLFAQATPSVEAPAVRPSTDFICAGLSLFSGDYAFAKTALQQLSIPTPIADFSPDDASQTLTLTAPRDLQDRLKVTLPIEVRNSDHRYTLCAKKDRITQAIEQARQAKAEEESWPTLHYLWPQHPIMDWLSDRVLTAFGRHRAPVIQCPQLAEGEQAFMLMGLIPNRKGQPLLIEWQVAVCHDGNWSLQPFPELAQRTQLQAHSLSNRNQGQDTQLLQSNLHAAAHGQPSRDLCSRND